MTDNTRIYGDFMNAFLGGRPSFTGLINTMLNDMGDLYVKNNEKLDEIRQEWHDSKKLPRKKKKAARKRILRDWSLFNWCKKHMEEQGYHHFVKKETAQAEPDEERASA